MNKFKVGDRVRVYYWDGYYDTRVRNVEGDFVYANVPGVAPCEFGDQVHYKQCRRLKPCKPLRSIYTSEFQLSRRKVDSVATFAFELELEKSLAGDRYDYNIEFREVRRKKK